jgi:hypothetical protein
LGRLQPCSKIIQEAWKNAVGNSLAHSSTLFGGKKKSFETLTDGVNVWSFFFVTHALGKQGRVFDPGKAWKKHCVGKQASLLFQRITDEERSLKRLTPEGRRNKTFFFETCEWAVQARSFVPGELFQPSILCESTVSAYSSGAPQG